jgi:hypothetical protein
MDRKQTRYFYDRAELNAWRTATSSACYECFEAWADGVFRQRYGEAYGGEFDRSQMAGGFYSQGWMSAYEWQEVDYNLLKRPDWPEFCNHNLDEQ